MPNILAHRLLFALLCLIAPLGQPASADDFDRIVKLRNALETIGESMDGRWVESAHRACYGEATNDAITAENRDDLPATARTCAYFDKFKQVEKVANLTRIQSLCGQATIRFSQLLEEIDAYQANRVLSSQVVLIPDENVATTKDDELEGAILKISAKIDEQFAAYRVRGGEFKALCENAVKAIKVFYADPVAVACPAELVGEIFNFEDRADQGCRVNRCLPIASELVTCTRTAFTFSGVEMTDRYDVNAKGVSALLGDWDSSCVADADRWAENQCDTVN